jgi:hypothetical protein
MKLLLYCKFSFILTLNFQVFRAVLKIKYSYNNYYYYVVI